MGDVRRRPRPVVTLLLLVALVVGTLLACPVLLAPESAAAEPAVVTVLKGEAAGHEHHSITAAACSRDSTVAGVSHARHLDRTSPDPSITPLAAAPIDGPASPRSAPQPQRLCAPEAAHRSGRDLLNRLVISQI